MKHIILTGFMGCGKSTVGFRLSRRMKRRLIDTDKRIEFLEKKTITDIFRDHGEQYFRQKETECLQGLTEEKVPLIIAVGGGTPLRQENRQLLHEMGTVFYLKASPDTIYERVARDKSRPLLQCEDPRKRIRELLQERGPVYEEGADYVIRVDGKSFSQIIDEMMEAAGYENSRDKRTEY